MTLAEVPPEPDSSGGEHARPRPRRSFEARTVKLLRLGQKYSAYCVVAFAGLHLSSTIVLPAFSVSAANSAFMAARSVYQSVPGEALFVYGPFGVHIVSGLMLRMHRMWTQWTREGRIGLARPSRTAVTGLLLAAAASLHFAQMRLGPLTNLGDSSLISLDYVTYLLRAHGPTTAGLLGALSVLFAVHALGGAARFLGLRLKALAQASVVGGGAALTLASLVSLARQPPVRGWLADQFAAAYPSFARLSSGR